MIPFWVDYCLKFMRWVGLGKRRREKWDQIRSEKRGEREEGEKKGYFYSMEYRPMETVSNYLLRNRDASLSGFLSRIDALLSLQCTLLYEKREEWREVKKEDPLYFENNYLGRLKRRLSMLADPNACLNRNWEGGESEREPKEDKNKVAKIVSKIVGSRENYH